MKLKNKKVIIATIIMLIIIIAGIVMAVVKGFAFDLKYQDAKRIELGIGQAFEEKDIKEIAKEVLGNEQITIQKIEVYEDAVSIMAKDITDEQKNEIITKVNEKYGTEISTDETTIIDVSHTRARDLLKPYVVPFLIVAGITIVYMMIRYHKFGAGKILVKIVLLMAISQILLFGIMAITRIPLGRLTLPLIIIVYLLTICAYTIKLEKREEKRKVD